MPSATMSDARTTAPISDFDPYSEEVLDDPYPYYEELRELGPVVYLKRYDAYAIARHAEAHAVLSDPETFCSSAGAGLTNLKIGENWRKPSIILEADPPYHARTRKVMARILAPASIGRFRPMFEREAEALIDKVLAMGKFDASRDFCTVYPLKVAGDALGLPAEGREHLLPYGDMVFNGFGPMNERAKRRIATATDAIEWINGVCQRDRLTKGGLGLELYAAADAGELTPEEAGMLVRTFMSAGLDTTVFTLCHALVFLAANADQYDMLRNDPSLARQTIEETVRYGSTFQSFYRTTAKPVELAGVQIGADQKIMVIIASANRDPRRWDNPDKFDIHRKPTGHLGFGTGIHGCAGQMLARMEGEIVLSALARKVSAIKIEGKLVRHYNNTVRGYDSIPARFIPVN